MMAGRAQARAQLSCEAYISRGVAAAASHNHQVAAACKGHRVTSARYRDWRRHLTVNRGFHCKRLQSVVVFL